MIDKIKSDIFKDIPSDIFLSTFTKVTNYDPEQILRYCRDDVFPLWFCKDNLLTVKNTKCKFCNGKLIFEFQVNFILT
jgi:hypothetical protein